MAAGLRILDGGMGIELERSGAPFRQPEWSALALMEAPARVADAHRAFIAAGAEVVTTNSYALVPFHIGEERFRARGRELADLAGRLAREAAEGAERPVAVSGSLPPVCGSYRPDLFRVEEAAPVLADLVAGLGPHVDLWLAETQSCLAEAQASRDAIGASDARPFWVSFTLEDELTDGRARLRSQESVTAAAEKAVELGAAALLFNCSQPEVMEAAVREAGTVSGVPPLGVYANTFAPRAADVAANEGRSPHRDNLDQSAYLDWARRWVDAGATLVGGCCGIGPAHIKVLSEGLRRGAS